MDSESGFGKRRAAPILTRENWRLWFRLQQTNLEGQEVFWVIADCQDTINSRTPQSEGSEASSSNGKAKEGFPGLEHSKYSPAWVKSNAKALYEILNCLGQDDQDEMMDEVNVYDVWTKLKAKYSKVQEAHAMAIIQEFVNYRMKEGDTIRGAWIHLGNLGRRIVEID